jgi:hypothetical protein
MTKVFIALGMNSAILFLLSSPLMCKTCLISMKIEQNCKYFQRISIENYPLISPYVYNKEVIFPPYVKVGDKVRAIQGRLAGPKISVVDGGTIPCGK